MPWPVRYGMCRRVVRLLRYLSPPVAKKAICPTNITLKLLTIDTVILQVGKLHLGTQFPRHLTVALPLLEANPAAKQLLSVLVTSCINNRPPY